MLIWPLLWILRRMPLSISRRLLRGLVGWPLYLANRRAALNNIKRALGDAHTEREYRDIVKTSCITLGDSLAEAIWVAQHGAGDLFDSLEGRESLREALATNPSKKGGWIALSGHIGNWELLGRFISDHSPASRVKVVAKRFSNQFVNGMIEQLRSDIGLDTIYQDQPPTDGLRHLRKGGVLGIIPDQDIKTVAGMFIEFFGRSAFTPVGPARLAIASGVPIYCVYLLRKPGGFRFHVGEPITADPTLPRAEQIAAVTRAWSHQVEQVIRDDPAQWQWFHDRWKTTPEKLAARGRRELDLTV